MKLPRISRLGLMLVIVPFAAATSCDRKEKVLDIKTPEGGIEVERDKRTGEISIQAESRDNR